MLSSLTRLERESIKDQQNDDVGVVNHRIKYVQVEALVPVRVERSLRNRRRLGLLAVDRCDGKRVGEACQEGKQAAMSVTFVRIRNSQNDTYGMLK